MASIVPLPQQMSVCLSAVWAGEPWGIAAASPLRALTQEWEEYEGCPVFDPGW